jgi:predicted DNA-binding antitoxin AbrB/MazE fold protein
MTRTVEAIYEKGVLRPLTPVEGLAEHARVRISIDQPDAPHPLLQFCGTLPDEDAREIEKLIADEFERVDPDEWK